MMNDEGRTSCGLRGDRTVEYLSLVIGELSEIVIGHLLTTFASLRIFGLVIGELFHAKNLRKKKSARQQCD